MNNDVSYFNLCSVYEKGSKIFSFLDGFIEGEWERTVEQT